MTLHDKEQHAHNLRNSGHTEEAIHEYNELFQVYDSANQFQQAGACLQMIGVCYKIDNDTEKSLQALHHAADYFATHQFEVGIGNTYRDIAITFEYVDRLDEAYDFMDKALTILKKANDKGGYAITLAKMGMLENKMGQRHEGLQHLEEALALLKDSPDWFFYATTLMHVSAVYRDEAQYDQCLKLIQEAEALFDQRPEETQTRRYAQLYGGQAYCLAKLGKITEAKEFFKKANDILDSGAFSPSAAAKVRQDIKADEIEEMIQ